MQIRLPHFHVSCFLTLADHEPLYIYCTLHQGCLTKYCHDRDSYRKITPNVNVLPNPGPAREPAVSPGVGDGQTKNGDPWVGLSQRATDCKDLCDHLLRLVSIDRAWTSHVWPLPPDGALLLHIIFYLKYITM